MDFSGTMKLFLLTLFALFSIISTNVDYWRDEPRVGVMARDNHHTIDSEKKNVKCPLGFIRCDGECVWNYIDVSTPGEPGSLRHCGEKCIWNVSQCDGKCADEFSPCGKSSCVNNDSTDKYYECNGICTRKYQRISKCNGKCEDGYFPCRRGGMDCLDNYYINFTNLTKYCD